MKNMPFLKKVLTLILRSWAGDNDCRSGKVLHGLCNISIGTGTVDTRYRYLLITFRTNIFKRLLSWSKLLCRKKDEKRKKMLRNCRPHLSYTLRTLQVFAGGFLLYAKTHLVMPWKKCYGNVVLTYANMSLNSYFSGLDIKVSADPHHASSKYWESATTGL